MLRQDFSIIRPAETDVFADIDEQDSLDEADIEELIHRVQGSENSCSVSEMLAAELEVPICAEFADTTWEDEFMAELGPQNKETCLSDEENCDLDEVEDAEPPPP